MQLYRNGETATLANEVLSQYRRVAGAVGDEGLVATLDAAVQELAPARRWYFYRQELANPNFSPSVYAFRHEAGLDEMVGAYEDQFAQSDPLNGVLRHVESDGAALAVSISPQDITDPLYRTRYMEQSDIVQRVSVFHRAADHCMVMNVGRNADEGELDEPSIWKFAAFSLLVFPLLERHEQLALAASMAPGFDVDGMERAVRGKFPLLTNREVQVCARTILGRSSKSIARDLQIGVESVVTYRKRAYFRLGVNGAEQLSRSVLN